MQVDGCQIEAKPFEVITSDGSRLYFSMLNVLFFQPKTHTAERQSQHGLVTRSNHFVNNTEYQVFVGGIPTNASGILIFGPRNVIYLAKIFQDIFFQMRILRRRLQYLEK